MPAGFLAACLGCWAQTPPSQPASSSSPAPEALAAILSRVSEESAVFEQSIVKALSTETLEQQSWMPPSRFKPRIGQQAAQTPKPRLQTRKIVSEYTVGSLKDADSRDLVELRQVVTVDGVAVQTRAAARHALSLGVQSRDDRARKRMLEDFAKNGLVDIATDYGLILLAFSKRGLANMQFGEEAERQVGSETARTITWKQLTAVGGELDFHGRQFSRIPLAGRLLVRKSDLLPLMVETWAESVDNKQTTRDEAQVAYQMSEHGFLTPAWVVHRHIVNGATITENHYRYEKFRLFSADAEITFTEVPDPPKPPSKK